MAPSSARRKPPTATPPGKTSGKGAAATGNGGRNRRFELVETEIYERAAELFARKGVGGTSLQDIADAMGTSRTALYYYVKNKDDLLAKLVAGVTKEVAGALSAIAEQRQLPPEERLRQMTRAIVSFMTAPDAIRFRLLVVSEQELPGELAEAHVRAKRLVRELLADVIAEGVRSGDFRPLDERVAAYSIIGMCNWTAFWFHPGPDHPAEPVIEQITDTALCAVRWPDEERRGGTGPAAAMARIRTALAALERSLPD